MAREFEEQRTSSEDAIGIDMYQLVGVIGFALMGLFLYRTAMKKHVEI
ncbi:MAG TPA: hypothetical protein VFW07_05755 [Parafilimonas sp.]|nr:hypothetical protein [Parafilimonas sp.]